MQRPKDEDASPYINHPIALMKVLCIEAGVRDPTILSAAALHDTIEDTETTGQELESEFGSEIASAWLNRCRRLAKDWENLNRKGLAFLRLASIRLMLLKLSNPA
jgi:(p)ppGpp synthase/HD superfamily hydrolase